MTDEVDPKVSEAARAMGRRRQELLGADGRKELASLAGKAGWARMTPPERRLEMKRRHLMARRSRVKKASRLRAVK